MSRHEDTAAQVLAEACARAMYATDQASKRLGVTVVDVHPGYAEVRMTVRKDMLGLEDDCDPGLIFTLADTAFAYACNTYNEITVASSCSIDLLGNAAIDSDLKAIARERWRRGRTGVYDVQVTSDPDEVIALFRGKSVSLKDPILKRSEREP